MNFEIDWRQFAGALAIGAALAALIAWQVRGVPEKCRGWLGSAALTLEALAMAMAVYWAVKQGAGILTMFFAGGFIGLTLAKAVTVSALVHAWQERKHGAFFVVFLALLGAYLSVYSAGVFEGSMHSASKHSEAAQASAPVQAVEAQISAAQARLDGLSSFADSGRAQAESDALRQQQAGLDAQRASLQSQLDAQQSKLASCPRNYFTNCINPTKAKIAELQGQISRIGGATGGEYAQKHSEYLGLQQHIANLEQKRADLLSGGAIAENSAAGADDRLIKWLFGLDSLEKAAGLKWIVFVAVFDLLSLLLRLGGDLLLGRDIAGSAARKMRALIDSGLSPEQAAAAMGNRPIGAMAFAPIQQPQAPSVADALQSFERNAHDDHDDDHNQVKTVYEKVGETKDCEHCGKPFALTRSNKRYCSDKCRQDAWELRTGKRVKKGKKSV